MVSVWSSSKSEWNFNTGSKFLVLYNQYNCQIHQQAIILLPVSACFWLPYVKDMHKGNDNNNKNTQMWSLFNIDVVKVAHKEFFYGRAYVKTYLSFYVKN